MAWYAVFQSVDGVLVSVGQNVTDDADLLAKGLEKTLLAEDPRRDDWKWNEATRQFDVVTPPKPIVSSYEFISRFTDTELDDIVDAAKNHANATVRKRVAVFLEKLNLMDAIQLDEPRVVSAINQLETAGLIGVGRAAEVLA